MFYVLLAGSCIVACVILAVGICWLNDHFNDALWRWKNPPEKLAAERDAFRQRLLNPDWNFYESHLQRPAPSALRELFSDHPLLLSHATGGEYDEHHYISSFEPLDELALIDTREWLGFDVISFANSDGDIIYLRPGPAEPDTVFITYHDGGDTMPLAADIATFLKRFREANR